MTRAIFPSLRGKHVLITGGGTGIGEAITSEFVRQGAEVTFLDIAEGPSRALEERLSDQQPAPRFIPCDLTDIEWLTRIIGDLAPIDILINNAANDDRHEFEKVTPDYWDDRMAVNLRHLFFAAQAVVPGMKQAGGGVIINLGSISWHLGLPDLALYQTAKAAIEGLTRSQARDLGGHGIRAVCVVPGAVRTERQMRLWHNPEEEQRIVTAQCLPGRVEPSDIAAMVLFLASDDARMCTGHRYFVDAGWC